MEREDPDNFSAWSGGTNRPLAKVVEVQFHGGCVGILGSGGTSKYHNKLTTFTTSYPL